MRTIGVVTTARSDYGIYLPLLRAIQAEPDLKLLLFVGGLHLAPEFGWTVKQIEADGFEIVERIEMLLASDSPEGIAKSIGLGIIGFAQALTRTRPDILVVLGDRFEMHAAAVAALPLKIPIAHLHGGEVTEGAIDDALRHSMTKLAHLHFVATEEYARRVRQLGEEPWRVTVSGALSLDNLRTLPLLSRAEMADRFGLSWEAAPLLVTFHPVTLEYEQTAWQCDQLLAALDLFDRPIIFTMPNADTSNSIVREKIGAFVAAHPHAIAIESLGTQGYFSLMSYAAAMVGNSSSGLIEAPSFKLPVVNIGTRQTGRSRAANVIDAGNSMDEIRQGVERAVSVEFRATLQALENPYGNGHAAEVMVERLKQVPLDARLTRKVFHDLEAST